MNQVTLTVPQRKALAKMLEQLDWGDCLWKRTKKQYEGNRDSVIRKLIREQAEKDGWLTTITEVSQLKKKLNAAKRALAVHSVEIDEEGDAGFVFGEASPFRAAIERRADKEVGTLDDLSRTFDKATLRLWTVTSADEAQKIVEELQNVG